MAEDLVKANDDEFFDQVGMFHTFIDTDPTKYGFTTGDADDLKADKTLFGASLGDFNTKQTSARAARQKKDADRDPCEERFRWMAGQFNKRPNVTNADRISAGLPPRDESLTKIVADLSTAPLLLVGQAGIHEHRVNFFMTSEDSTATKKPQGVDGAKIYLKIDGTASTDRKDYQMVAFDKKQPYLYAHEPADAGKQAHYMAVWATDDDDAESPQSEVFSLMIT